MTSSIAKMAAAAAIVVAVALFGLTRVPGTNGVSLLTTACAAEESLFVGSDIVHIQNEIIVYAGSSDLPAGVDFVWLPMCSVKPDGGLRVDQLKLAAAPESYVVTDHSWYDPATGRFSRILKAGDAVVFANSYDGQFVYDATVTPEGAVQVAKQAISGAFKPPQSPAEYLGIAPGLKTALAQDDAMVQSVEQGACTTASPRTSTRQACPIPTGSPRTATGCSRCATRIPRSRRRNSFCSGVRDCSSAGS